MDQFVLVYYSRLTVLTVVGIIYIVVSIIAKLSYNRIWKLDIWVLGQFTVNIEEKQKFAPTLSGVI